MKKSKKISFLLTIAIVFFAILSPNLMGQKNNAQAFCYDGDYGTCFVGWAVPVTTFCGGVSFLLNANIPICILTMSGGAGGGNDLGTVPGIGYTCMDANLGLNPVTNFAICESIALTLVGIRCHNEHLIPCVCTPDKSTPPAGTMCPPTSTGREYENLPNNKISDKNLPWLTVGNNLSNCTSSRKCEYYTSTTSYSCTGSIPSGSIMCAGDNTGLIASIPWLSIGSTPASCTSSRKCEYYTPATPYACTGSIPSGSIMCAGDNTGLTSNGLWHNVSSCGPQKCEFTTPTSLCGGNIPSGSSACPGDGAGPGTWALVGGCSSARCEYITPTAPPAGPGDNGDWIEVKPN